MPRDDPQQKEETKQIGSGSENCANRRMAEQQNNNNNNNGNNKIMKRKIIPHTSCGATGERALDCARSHSLTHLLPLFAHPKEISEKLNFTFITFDYFDSDRNGISICILSNSRTTGHTKMVQFGMMPTYERGRC